MFTLTAIKVNRNFVTYTYVDNTLGIKWKATQLIGVGWQIRGLYMSRENMVSRCEVESFLNFHMEFRTAKGVDTTEFLTEAGDPVTVSVGNKIEVDLALGLFEVVNIVVVDFNNVILYTLDKWGNSRVFSNRDVMTVC